MKNIISLLLILTASISVSSYRLQGSWKLIEVDGLPVLSETVDMQIQDFVFRSLSVQQKITFSGCQQYKYIMEVQDNNIFIIYNSFLLQPTNSTCSEAKLVMHTAIQSSLQKAFYFQIFGNFLLMLNPQNNNLLRFQRKQSTRIKNIRGVWNMAKLNSVKKSLTVSILDTEISLCQDKLTIAYQFSGQFQIKMRVVSDNGCQMQELATTVIQSKYYRRKGEQITILNQDLQQIMFLTYVSALDLQAIAQQKEKAIKQAQQIDERNRIANQLAAQIQQNNSQNGQSGQFVLSNTADDMIGRWEPTSVFGIPLPDTAVFLVFTRDQVVYNGGCNSYIFQYSVDASARQITMGRNRSSSNICAIDDDGLYVSAVSKMNKYSITLIGQQIVFRVIDSQGNSVYELRRTAISNLQSSSSQSKDISSQTVQTQDNSFVNGRYVFLILSRRDLPRKFCTITDSKITYQGCNILEHLYRMTGSGNVTVNGGIIGTNQCQNNNDEIMFNAFNSVASFVVGEERGSYRLRNKEGIDVINLSLS